MSDFRWCSLCEQFVDIDLPNTQIFESRGGHGSRKTIIQNGTPHFVTTKQISARKAAKMAAAKENKDVIC